MKRPLVSLISITYHQTAATAEMIASVLAGDYDNLEIIIVDNGAEGSDAALLLERFPEIRLISSPRNLGFAGGNNLGTRAAQGEYFFYLNNDTLVAPEAISALVAELESHPRAGLTCPKIRFHRDPEVLQFAGYTGMSGITLRHKAIGFHERDRGQHDQLRATPFAHGAAMMARRAMVQEVGMMAEYFFLYYEEMDWCARIRAAGWEILFIPQAVIWHKESLTTGRASPLKSYYLARNRVLFLLRNLHGWQRIIALLYHYLVALPKSALAAFCRLDFAQGRAVLAAWKWAVKNQHNPEIYRNHWLDSGV